MFFLQTSDRTLFMQSKWREIQLRLLKNVGKTQYNVWLGALSMQCDDSTVTIAAPSLFIHDFLRKQFVPTLSQAIKYVLGEQYTLVIAKTPCKPHEIIPKLDASIFDAIVTAQKTPSEHMNAERVEDNSTGNILAPTSLVPRPLPKVLPNEQLALPVALAEQKNLPVHWRFNFENFVVGPNNELAYAASRSICTDYSADMFFLSSAPGLGKTHLMQAAGQALTSACNKMAPKIAYLTAEEFISRFIHSIRNNGLESFKSYFRQLDLLLLEDIHFLQGKEKTQIELLSTIKALSDKGSKVVFTSSFAPKELQGFDEQLLSRFYAGFLSTIGLPDKETRKKIFKHKAAVHQVILPEEVEETLAENISGDVRQIESCLHNLILKARVYESSEITLQMAWDVIGNYITKTPLSDIDGIVKVICEVFGLSLNELFSTKRKQDFVVARNAAFYLARKHTNLSLEVIGRKFNRRHSTVLKGITNLEREISRETPEGRQMANTLAMIERNGRLSLQ